MRYIISFFKKIVRWVVLRSIIDEGNDFFLRSWVRDSKISNRCRLYPLYHISESCIGDYTYVARNSNISKTSIGKFCSIGPNFLCGWGIHPLNGISSSPMFYSTQKQNGMTLTIQNKVEERKPISIGNDVFIGANVTVLDGVSIGDGAVIGAGAVVSKNIPPYAIAVGCPIRVIKYRFPHDTIESLLKMEWWDFREDKLRCIEEYFFDIELFLKVCGKNEYIDKL